MAATATLPQRRATGKFTNISAYQRSGVLVLRGFGITVNVRRGHLHVEDGMCGERWGESLARVGHGLRRLVVIGNDGLISLAALRWLADQDVAFTLLDRQGRVITTCGPVYPSDARLRRAQALAHHSGAALKIARHLIVAKLAGQEQVARERLDNADSASVIANLRLAASEAASLESVLLCEREGANAYWSAWRGWPIGFSKRDVEQVPRHWLAFNVRRSPLSLSSRLAADPLNAMLNYTYALLEAEARLAATACGLDPGLAFLHMDTEKQRDSLACDLQEPIRPMVDAWLLDRLASGPLRRADFFEERNGNCRLMSGLCAELAKSMPAWAKSVAPHAEYVMRTLWEHAKQRKPSAGPPPTPLTRTHLRIGKGGGAPAASTVPAPKLLNNVCGNCGRPVGSAQPYCFECISAARESNETKAQRSATIARHRAAQRSWNPSQKPAWLTEEVMSAQVIPRLREVSLVTIARTLGISHAYAIEIRSGARCPHPRHWEEMARLAGLSERQSEAAPRVKRN